MKIKSTHRGHSFVRIASTAAAAGVYTLFLSLEFIVAIAHVNVFCWCAFFLLLLRGKKGIERAQREEIKSHTLIEKRYRFALPLTH